MDFFGTPGMGMNLWGESPLWVNQHRIWSRISPPMITTSLRQVQSREGLCGGSLTAKVRADGQKAHTRPSLVGECAKEHKALWFERYGKCDSCALKVHAPSFL